MKKKFYDSIFKNIFYTSSGYSEEIHHFFLKCYYEVFGIPGNIYLFCGEDDNIKIRSFEETIISKKKPVKKIQDLDFSELLSTSSEFLKEVVGIAQIEARATLYLWKHSFVYINISGDVYLTTSNKEDVSDFSKLLKIEKSENKGTYFRYLTIGTKGVERHTLSFDKLEIDIDKYYNSDLPWDKIQNFVSSSKEGLILLYGCPGSGKTSLLKYLIQENQDKEIYLIQGKDLINIKDTGLFRFFLSHQNSIFILEDCEELLAQRTRGTDLSTLLNLTDGIIGNSLKLRFICTFNTNLGNIDKALLRKGRLKLKYEFGPLSIDKTKNLYPDATKELTLAEIFNREEINFSKNRKIGF